MMRQLRWLVWRQWTLRPWRASVSTFSVAIAVAAMLGTSISQSTVHDAYDTMTRAVNGSPTLDLIPAAGGRFLVDELPSGTMQGVKSIVPVLLRGTILRFKGQRLRSVVLGVDGASLQRGLDLRLVEGEFPTDREGALLEHGLAEANGIRVGDKLTVLGRRGPRSCWVRGFLTSSTLSEFAEGATLVLPLTTAQDFFGLPDQVDRGRVFLVSSEFQEPVREALSRQFGSKFFVREPLRAGGIAAETLRSAELALYFSTALSLVMSIVVVLNTLRMSFHERRRELAIMRALGASQQQIGWLIGLEGVLAGGFGAVIGVPLGLGLAYFLSYVLNGLLQTSQPFTWPPISAVACAIGVGEMAVVAAIVWSRWGVEKIPPAEAMRELEMQPGERPPRRLFLVAVVAWGLAVLMLSGVQSRLLSDQLTLPAGLLMLVSYLGTLPLLLPRVLGLQGWLMPRRWWVYQLLSSSQLTRRPIRLGMTAGVMVVAISSGLGLGSAIISNIAEVREWYRRTMSGDYLLLTAATTDTIAYDGQQLRQELIAISGVRDAEAISFLPARTGAESIMCVVRDFQPSFPFPWPMPDSDESRVRAALVEGQILIGSVLAHRLQISVGESLVLEHRSRNHAFPVAGIVNDYHFGGLCVFLQSTAARRRLEIGVTDIWVVRVQESERASPQLRDQLAVLARENGLYAQSFAEARHGLDQMLNGIVAALWSLIAVGFVISGLAIMNTLAMHVSEQTREFGLLRVVGMPTMRICGLVLFQSLILGIGTTFLGTLAGITTGFVIHWCSEPLTGRTVPFTISPWLLFSNLGGALFVTIVAAIIPAWRASRLHIAETLAYD